MTDAGSVQLETVAVQEVHWYGKGIKPTLKEHMDVAASSAGGLVMLLASYFLATEKLMEEGLDYISKIPSVVHCSAEILRLTNDLSTSLVTYFYIVFLLVNSDL